MLYALVIKKMLHHKCVQHFLDEPGAKMHRLCTIGVSVDWTVNSARLINRPTD